MLLELAVTSIQTAQAENNKPKVEWLCLHESFFPEMYELGSISAVHLIEL